MTTTKNVSKEGYVWGHFGTILFHLIIALLLIFNRRFFNGEEKLRRWFFWIGIVLAIFSILALIPIFMHYNKDYEYVIDMNG